MIPKIVAFKDLFSNDVIRSGDEEARAAEELERLGEELEAAIDDLI